MAVAARTAAPGTVFAAGLPARADKARDATHDDGQGGQNNQRRDENGYGQLHSPNSLPILYTMNVTIHATPSCINSPSRKYLRLFSSRRMAAKAATQGV